MYFFLLFYNEVNEDGIKGLLTKSILKGLQANIGFIFAGESRTKPFKCHATGQITGYLASLYISFFEGFNSIIGCPGRQCHVGEGWILRT